jgi:hypothetical protein
MMPHGPQILPNATPDHSPKANLYYAFYFISYPYPKCVLLWVDLAPFLITLSISSIPPMSQVQRKLVIFIIGHEVVLYQSILIRSMTHLVDEI